MKLVLGIVVGVLIGLAAVPAYDAIRGSGGLSTSEIEVALIK